MNRIILTLGLLVLAPSCNCGPVSVEADGGRDGGTQADAGTAAVDAGTTDAGLLDAGLIDAGQQCPNLSGGWTFLQIDAACPAGDGTNVYDTNIAQTGCQATLRNPPRASSRLSFEGTVTLDTFGNFAATTFTVNDAGTTCSGISDAGSPRSVAVTCANCAFSIRFGE